MAWQSLFGTESGILSLLTIGFVLFMAMFFINFIRRHIREDESATGNRGHS